MLESRSKDRSLPSPLSAAPSRSSPSSARSLAVPSPREAQLPPPPRPSAKGTAHPPTATDLSKIPGFFRYWEQGQPTAVGSRAAGRSLLHALSALRNALQDPANSNLADLKKIGGVNPNSCYLCITSGTKNQFLLTATGKDIAIALGVDLPIAYKVIFEKRFI